MPPALSLGFSPCPNDTFIFHALISGQIPLRHFSLLPPVLADVETLNGWARDARLEVTKLSFHAFGHVRDEYRLLASGSALGRGCGPLLVGHPGLRLDSLAGETIAVPGLTTTAAMLLTLCLPQCQKIMVMPFDQILPALVAGTIGAGVIIHESRFTYQRHGLRMLIDLGAWWEETTTLPIPLGGIVARRSLGDEVIVELEMAIRQSLQAAFRDPLASRPYIRFHAQETEDQVIDDHIALYVNDHSLALGEEGRAAVNEFLIRGQDAGLFPVGPLLP